MVVKIFLVMLFRAPSSAVPGCNCPSPPSYATTVGWIPGYGRTGPPIIGVEDASKFLSVIHVHCGIVTCVARWPTG